MTHASPDDLYRWVGDRPEGPLPLIVNTDGWIEASEAAARIQEIITHQGDLEPLVQFDTDLLIDERSRRPLVHMVDGVIKGFDWPSIELAIGSDRDDRPFLYLHGAEPDRNWRAFAEATAVIATAAGADTMYSIAAYPVPAPHTRPTRVSSVSTCAALVHNRTHTTGSMTVPAGVQMVIGDQLAKHGIEFLGLFAQVPYYISTMAWPQAAINLMGALAETAKLEFDLTALAAQQADASEAVEAMISESPGLATMIAELEQRHDELRLIDDVGTGGAGDQLEAQLQEFLRDIGDD